MKTLHVFFDHECGMCSRFRRWLERQPKFVEIRFTSYHDPEAKRICPVLDELHPEDKLVVMADTGEVYQGETAWIMCLWALENYRGLSMTLARPRWLPLARRVCTFVSEKRYSLSRFFFRTPRPIHEQQLLETVEAEKPAQTCVDGVCPI
ncbi:MAG: putative DCC family thiol-disulfide oxidoreductase YuxK [Verrucomicrobiales bacterium]